MSEIFSRTELLLGQDALELLSLKKVAIFGVGGVGGYACEALVRSGIGSFDLIDDDVVSMSNINRQIIALHSTVGKQKTEVMKQRMLDINPNVKVRCINAFFLPKNAASFPFEEYDYIVDAIDTVSGKIELVEQANIHHVPIMSSMGAGNKLDPTRFEVSDIYDTSVCPLCRVMRRELKKRNIKSLKVVYSKEEPLTPIKENAKEENGCNCPDSHSKRVTPGSVAFVPSVAGLIIASEVVKDLLK